VTAFAPMHPVLGSPEPMTDRPEGVHSSMARTNVAE